MKVSRILLTLVVFLGGSGFVYVRTHPESQAAAYLQQLTDRWQEIADRARERFRPQPKAKEKAKASGLQKKEATANSQKSPPAAKKKRATPSAAPAKKDPTALANERTLYLKNGGIVTGELVSDSPEAITLRWEYGDVTFKREEIKRVASGKQDTDEGGFAMPWEGEGGKKRWPYRHNVVVKLTKGTVVDARISTVGSEALVLTQTLPSGGAVEHTVRYSDIEQLLFRPIRNARSRAIEEQLKTVFPDMRWDEEGLFTIVSDSIPPTIREYRKAIRELAADWYLAFYPLLKGRVPLSQQYVVIFENWDSYIEYAATDGVPGWLIVGYFDPQDEVLYCFNMVGERFSEMLYSAYLGQFRQARDQVSAAIKGSEREVFIEGQMSEFLQKLESAHAMVRQVFGQLSVDILRHELTHGLFHNWRLQSIVLSKMPEKSPEELAQKKRFLQAEDPEEKRRLLDGLLSQKGEAPLPEMQASNSWVVEGLAGYMEPSPMGGLNRERLAQFQEAQRQKQILPLEFLNAFRMGSFPGMANQSALYAYAQSWAFCHFLMQRYPEAFMAYQKRLADEPPKEGEDTLPWLPQALGKEQRALEQEFLDYAAQFPTEDPFWLKQMQGFIDLRSELTALAAQLWGR